MNAAVDERRIAAAGLWLASQKKPPALAVPTLKAKFELTALEACKAIKHAQDLRALRRGGDIKLEFSA